MTEKVSCPEPGVHRGISADEYHSWDAVNASLLKEVDKKSPAHAHQSRLSPRDPTEAMRLGEAVHTAILEPERFVTDYFRVPNADKRTKAGKKVWEEAEAEAGDRILLRADDYDKAVTMRENATRRAGSIREILLAKGVSEVSIVWDDEKTGIRCKARIDKLTAFGKYPVLLDLKTTQDASADSFARDCARYGYQLQAAFYLDGANAVAPRDRNFLFLALEKTPPYCGQLHELGHDSLRSGRISYRHALRRWQRCMETGDYPGYPDGVSAIEIPAWAMDLDDSLLPAGEIE